MPKVGMEPIRKSNLIDATIMEIGAVGSLDITVSAIARRAGMSSGLAHHYFGGKDQIFLASMRHIFTVYGKAVRSELAKATTPLERVEGIIHASFAAENFRPEVITAWLNFYVLARSSEDAHRLLRVYQKRIISNLTHALRPLVGANAHDAAKAISASIDGIYLREGLSDRAPDAHDAKAMVLRQLALELQEPM